MKSLTGGFISGLNIGENLIQQEQFNYLSTSIDHRKAKPKLRFTFWITWTIYVSITMTECMILNSFFQDWSITFKKKNAKHYLGERIYVKRLNNFY